MVGYVIFLLPLYLLVSFCVLVYFFIKTKYALQAFQQSAYNNGRYINYIKSNYKYSFGINELLPIFILFFNVSFVNIGWLLLKYILVFFFLYYNLKFFNISKRNYTEKIKLNVTARVKRLLFTLVVLVLLFLIIFGFSLFNLLLINYFIYLIIMLANIINVPMERYIRRGFKKKAMKKLESFSNLTVIGITGSYGKTSIKNIINDVLKDYEITLPTPSSFNTPMGLSITINNDLNKMHENFIAEMGAYYKGEIKELALMVKPKIAVVSSIGPQHLETFKNIENVQSTKMELVEYVDKDGIAILNYDNKYIREYEIKNPVKTAFYSIENKDVDLYADNIVYLEDGMSFDIYFKDQKYTLKTKLLGKHNVYNILAAILVADYKGISIDNIIKSISKLSKIEHRLELKEISNDLTIIDDSFNGNIEGLKEGVNILSKYKETKVLITPGLIDGGEENYALNVEYAKSIKGIDHVIFIGNYNRKALNEGIEKCKDVQNFDNFIDGYNYAINNVKGKKVILMANDLPDKYN